MSDAKIISIDERRHADKLAGKLILGIDFNNIMYSSYYTPELINTKGINVNAVKGFFFKLKNLREYLNPDYIVICNDLGREKTFRKKIFSGYKSTRQPTPSSIGEQFAYAMQIIQALGYRNINDENYEADDVLGMTSRFAMDNGMRMVIASSDRDFYQLITDKVNVFSMKYKEIIDRQWIYDKYHLVPEQLIELKALVGDKTDNIPGAYGIGENIGLELIQRWGSVEAVYKNLEMVKPLLRNKLEMNKRSVEMSKLLGTIVTDYSLIGLDKSMITRNEPNPGELYETLRYLEIYSLYNVMQYTLLGDKQENELANIVANF
jgi:DNA polymerase-1